MEAEAAAFRARRESEAHLEVRNGFSLGNAEGGAWLWRGQDMRWSGAEFVLSIACAGRMIVEKLGRSKHDSLFCRILLTFRLEQRNAGQTRQKLMPSQACLLFPDRFLDLIRISTCAMTNRYRTCRQTHMGKHSILRTKNGQTNNTPPRRQGKAKTTHGSNQRQAPDARSLVACCVGFARKQPTPTHRKQPGAAISLAPWHMHGGVVLSLTIASRVEHLVHSDT